MTCSITISGKFVSATSASSYKIFFTLDVWNYFLQQFQSLMLGQKTAEEMLKEIATKINTALEFDCWTKRVISPALIEKLCQLMMALGVLVICRTFPMGATATVPFTTAWPVGLASVWPDAKQAATARVISLSRIGCAVRFWLRMKPP